MAPTLQQVDRTYVKFRGRRLAYFAGCDYFRLSSDPRVVKAVGVGLKRYGLNVAASRLTTGNHVLYQRLERGLAAFFGAEGAVLAANGYTANLLVAQTLAGRFSHVLIDEKAHGSQLDAAHVMDCPVVKFKHRDPDDLARIIQRLGEIQPVVMTDGLFPGDGAIAPIEAYLAVLPAGGRLMVDDAHAGGLLGKRGRGTPECAGVSSPVMIQTVTLSKAFGAYGGAVLGTRELISEVVARSRMFAGNTPVPLPLVAGALESLAIMRKSGKNLRKRLADNVIYLKAKLRAGGFPVPDFPTPIIPLTPASVAERERLRRKLLARGVFPSFINYPGAPEGGYYRFVISSEHTRGQLDALAGALT